MFFGCFGQNSLSEFDKKKKEFSKTIKKRKWSEPNKVLELIEPVILVSNGNETDIGSSKFGGTPDLPVGTEWPKYKNHSMVFFAQINLKEIADLHQDSLLPKTGILYFFSYFENPENEYGAYYEFLKDKSEYKVLYSDNDLSDLQQTIFPNDLISDYQFKTTPIDFYLDFQVPETTETWKYENAKLNAKDELIYDELINETDDNQQEMVLGTPYPIQYGADYDWAYSYLKITDFKDPRLMDKVNTVRPNFVNLFSFSLMFRFESIGISNCYFGILKEDLKNKKFDNVIFIMQDT